MTTPSMRPMSVVSAALCAVAALVIVPLWAPIVLGAWFADLLGPAVRRLERLLGGRRRAAGALVVLVAIGVLLPLTGIVLALAASAEDLFGQVRGAIVGGGSIAGALLGGDPVGSHSELGDWAALASRHGANAWRALSAVARASASAALATLVFVGALYTFLVEGARGYAWLEAHAPITRDELGRLARAFRETGRGLIVAGGGTVLVQGAVATTAYVLIGIPHALILGPLTAAGAIVPFIGTAVVWIPLAIELATRGQYWRAGAIVVTGIAVGLIDNVVRPMLTRYGHLQLPTFVVLISMLGGVVAFGATGALLGPLVVRLCVESLAIVAERRRNDASPATGTTGD